MSNVTEEWLNQLKAKGEITDWKKVSDDNYIIRPRDLERVRVAIDEKLAPENEELATSHGILPRKINGEGVAPS